ncbi:hypothetical protein [Rhodovarius sp.]|uniref:hypothetical protein n=1 Tax=Rhodovarius sp. TaxID=2972673 RepID=UPI0034A3102A
MVPDALEIDIEAAKGEANAAEEIDLGGDVIAQILGVGDEAADINPAAGMGEFGIGLDGWAGAGLADAAEDIVAGEGGGGVEGQAALAQAGLRHGGAGGEKEAQQGRRAFHEGGLAEAGWQSHEMTAVERSAEKGQRGEKGRGVLPPPSIRH